MLKNEHTRWVGSSLRPNATLDQAFASRMAGGRYSGHYDPISERVILRGTGPVITKRGRTWAEITSLRTLHGDTRSVVSSPAWSARATVCAGLLVVLLFGVQAFERRWISDDGMIVVRVVRQILAGAGPNFNPFQRDEVATSPLWTWLLAAFAFVVRGDVAVDAVVLGMVLAVAGLALAVFGSLNLHRQRGATGLLLPVGVLVPVAVGGFWDFATSGLETGLSIFWLGLVWWLVVSVTEEATRARLVSVAVVVGIGPLVRPDFAMATAVFGIALLLIVRPGWRSGLAYAGIGAVLPLGYQIFRMGYYGLVVPTPALAKEAASSLWARGFAYLMDYVNAYLIWIPLLLIAVIVAQLLNRTSIDQRGAVLMARRYFPACCSACTWWRSAATICTRGCGFRPRSRCCCQ